MGILQGFMQGNNTTQVNTQVPTQVGGTRTNEDVATRKKKELENAKRMVDLPYLCNLMALKIFFSLCNSWK